MPELRKDPIVGAWVIIAADRDKRPSSFRSPPPPPETGVCPFCPGQEHLTPPEIIAYREENSQANGPGWWTRVFPNRFPALKIEGDLERQGVGMFDMMSGVGAHEVIVETPEHNTPLYALGDHQIEKILWAYRDRIMDLRRDTRLRYALIFKNHGLGAGASLSHSHSQLIATPIIPKRVKEELDGAKDYYQLKERCIFCDIARQELENQERLVAENKTFLAFAPFASRFPFETWVMPKNHSHCFTQLTKEEAIDLARILKSILSRMSKSLESPPFNYILHTCPSIREGESQWYTLASDFHWHIEIMPRLIGVAGFEWGSGFYINPTSPEEAARFLKEESL